jgi:hypothetical protein
MHKLEDHCYFAGSEIEFMRMILACSGCLSLNVIMKTNLILEIKLLSCMCKNTPMLTLFYFFAWRN